MKDAQWINEGPPNASPATWVDGRGRGCIDPLAFAMADETMRQALLEEAVRMQREHAERRACTDDKHIVSNALGTAIAAEESGVPNDLLFAINDVIAANMRLIQQLGVLRDHIGPGLQVQGGGP